MQISLLLCSPYFTSHTSSPVASDRNTLLTMLAFGTLTLHTQAWGCVQAEALLSSYHRRKGFINEPTTYKIRSTEHAP